MCSTRRASSPLRWKSRTERSRDYYVTRANKGDVPVKKYKTDKKMALAGQGHYRNAAFPVPQDQYVGTTYIGYSYIDEYGVEQIYWFPYDMILDGDTGAITYVPAQ